MEGCSQRNIDFFTLFPLHIIRKKSGPINSISPERKGTEENTLTCILHFKDSSQDSSGSGTATKKLMVLKWAVIFIQIDLTTGD